MELNERISAIINSNSNDVQKEFYTRINEIEEKIQMRPKKIYGRGNRNNIFKIILF